MEIVNVVLSGGVGSRLWPLSRKSRPKQYIPFFENQSLFQKTITRNITFSDKVIIVGNKENYQLSRTQLASRNIPILEEIIEASPRNTAAAIAFAAFSANPDDILFVTPSDHLIDENSSYIECAKRAIDLAKQDFLVTFGIKPSRVDTGFGYIEFEGENVLSFREKPDYDTAKSFLDTGNFLWNSGIFCFKSGIYLKELLNLCPEVYFSSQIAFNCSMEGKVPLEESLKIPSISVDYAVMEKSKKVKVVKSDFDWSDMGSFAAIYDYLKAKGHTIDDMGNMVIGLDIHSEFVGLRDTILIYTHDALLIVQKENSQNVKTVFEKLETEKPELVN